MSRRKHEYRRPDGVRIISCPGCGAWPVHDEPQWVAPHDCGLKVCIVCQAGACICLKENVA